MTQATRAGNVWGLAAPTAPAAATAVASPSAAVAAEAESTPNTSETSPLVWLLGTAAVVAALTWITLMIAQPRFVTTTVRGSPQVKHGLVLAVVLVSVVAALWFPVRMWWRG